MLSIGPRLIDVFRQAQLAKGHQLIEPSLSLWAGVQPHEVMEERTQVIQTCMARDRFMFARPSHHGHNIVSSSLK